MHGSSTAGAVGKMIDHLSVIAKRVEATKGRFDLLGMVLRDEAERWDIVAAADWFGRDKQEAINFLSKQLQLEFTQDELMMISRVVPLQDGDRFLINVLQSLSGTEEIERIRGNFFGVEISDGYIVTSVKRTRSSKRL